VVNAGYLNGDFSGISNFDVTLSTSPLVQYFTNKLNAKQCPAGSATSGLIPDCKHFSDANSSSLNSWVDTHSGRWILPTGAQIRFCHTSWNVNPRILGFAVEYKQREPNIIGDPKATSTLIYCNISDNRSVIDDDSITYNIPQGHCQPHPASMTVHNDLWN
jgi:hypothetical protein